jgi:hypothetical protein
LIFAVDEVSMATPHAHGARTAQETDADAVTDTPSGDALPEGVDDADDFVSGYHRLVCVVAQTVNGELITMAHTATVHSKSHMTRLGPDQLTLHQLKLTVPCDLKSTIRRHILPPFAY